MVHVHVTKRVVALYAIAVLGILEYAALHAGIDGALFVPVATLIAGLGGYAVAKSPANDAR